MASTSDSTKWLNLPAVERKDCKTALPICSETLYAAIIELEQSPSFEVPVTLQLEIIFFQSMQWHLSQEILGTSFPFEIVFLRLDLEVFMLGNIRIIEWKVGANSKGDKTMNFRLEYEKIRRNRVPVLSPWRRPRQFDLWIQTLILWGRPKTNAQLWRIGSGLGLLTCKLPCFNVSSALLATYQWESKTDQLHKLTHPDGTKWQPGSVTDWLTIKENLR